MNDAINPHAAPAGADELAAERDRLEISPAMPEEADRVEPEGDDSAAVHIKRERSPRMTH